MRATTLVGLLCLTVVSPASSQECGSSARVLSRYCFALDVVQALREAHNAYVLYGDSVGLAPCFVNGGADVLYRAKQREAAFRQAFEFLRGAGGTRDSSIILTRDALAFVFVTHQADAFDIQRLCKFFMDGKVPPGYNSPSQIGDSMASARLRLTSAGKMALIAVAELCDGLADIDPATNTLGLLLLSEEQRQALLSLMRDAFGQEVAKFNRSNPTMLATDFATAGATLYSFIADRRWKLRPVPGR